MWYIKYYETDCYNYPKGYAKYVWRKSHKEIEECAKYLRKKFYIEKIAEGNFQEFTKIEFLKIQIEGLKAELEELEEKF